MPVNNLEFGTKVGAWAKKTEKRMTAVFRESTQRLISKCQEDIPVDTGFARASIRASLESMPSIDPDFRGAGEDSNYPENLEYVVSIANAKLGETIYVGWTASYVIYLEYGSSRQAPSGFVRINAMQWKEIVEDTISDAKSRAG